MESGGADAPEQIEKQQAKADPVPSRKIEGAAYIRRMRALMAEGHLTLPEILAMLRVEHPLVKGISQARLHQVVQRELRALSRQGKAMPSVKADSKRQEQQKQQRKEQHHQQHQHQQQHPTGPATFPSVRLTTKGEGAVLPNAAVGMSERGSPASSRRPIVHRPGAGAAKARVPRSTVCKTSREACASCEEHATSVSEVR